MMILNYNNPRKDRKAKLYLHHDTLCFHLLCGSYIYGLPYFTLHCIALHYITYKHTYTHMNPHFRMLNNVKQIITFDEDLTNLLEFSERTNRGTLSEVISFLKERLTISKIENVATKTGSSQPATKMEIRETTTACRQQNAAILSNNRAVCKQEKHMVEAAKRRFV